jgi:hypothetical protein
VPSRFIMHKEKGLQVHGFAAAHHNLDLLGERLHKGVPVVLHHLLVARRDGRLLRARGRGLAPGRLPALGRVRPAARYGQGWLRFARLSRGWRGCTSTLAQKQGWLQSYALSLRHDWCIILHTSTRLSACCDRSISLLGLVGLSRHRQEQRARDGQRVPAPQHPHAHRVSHKKHPARTVALASSRPSTPAY